MAVSPKLIALGAGCAAVATAVTVGVRRRAGRSAQDSGAAAPPPAPAGADVQFGANGALDAQANALLQDADLITANDGAGPLADDEELVAAEEAAAAAEAAAIGGNPGTSGPAPTGDETVDPAFEAVYEGGGGEAEGFEAAEQQLIDNASHSEDVAVPHLDAPTPEIESDRSTAEYGEADEERPADR